MTEPSVSVRNLTKSFTGRKVVDDLSFDVQKGEVFALLGHNGAGKSTTIRLILDMVQRDGGTVTILGRDSRTVSVHTKEEIGVVLGSEVNEQYIKALLLGVNRLSVLLYCLP